MTKAHHRSKSPEIVRQTLLDCAAQVIAEEGLTGLTQAKVIRRAGISKGGLQHHFPTRQALVDGVVAHLQTAMLEEVHALMAKDPNPNGARHAPIFTPASERCPTANRRLTAR